MKGFIAISLLLFFVASCSWKKSPGDNIKSDWTEREQFYPVYRFSNQVTGITIELNTIFPFADSVFAIVDRRDSIGYMTTPRMRNCVLVDKTVDFSFYKHAVIDSLLTSNINRYFFVYCTKGVAKRSIKDVVFSLDECKSNIIVLRFAPIDPLLYGHPLFCSTRDMPLNFSSNLAFDSILLSQSVPGEYYYADSIKSKTFAYYDTLFCTYSDNFSWTDSSNSGCYFPSRSIFIKRPGEDSTHLLWGYGLDLFGIPCD